MPLPGKLCIGIIEEDNPLKSYFRFKPILVENNGKYEPYQDASEFQEEGCIRIVPDKNESSHFKIRMREIGRYCMVDLRMHPGESDKIRANKNYRIDSGEHNSHIIYSDVIRFPAEASIFEILPFEAAADAAQMALVTDMPATERVLLLSGGSVCPALWSHSAMREPEGAISLTRTEQMIDINAFQLFKLQGFHGKEISFAIRCPSEKETCADAEPIQSLAVQEAACEPKQEKPWICRQSFNAEMEEPELNLYDRAMAAQRGINPKRGRSLQEIIDEKWRHSRMEQLGAPVPTLSMGHPADNPVEVVTKQIRALWDIPSARESLLNALSEMEEFHAAALERQRLIQQQDVEERLNALEARRLELSDELRMLEKDGDAMRSRLKTQIRTENAEELADMTAKLEDTRKEVAALQREAETLRSANKEAEKRFVRSTSEQLRQRLLDVAMDNCAVKLAAQIGKAQGDAPVGVNVAASVDAEQLITMLNARLNAVGICADRFTAANLLYCAVFSPMTILSGAAGCGKSAVADILSSVLGVSKAEQLERLAVSADCGGARVIDRLAKNADSAVMSILLLEDVNSASAYNTDMGMAIAANAQAVNKNVRVLMTAQDSAFGMPINAQILDKSFFVRIQNDDEAAWILPKVESGSMKPISIDALKAMFERRTEISAETIEKMEKLRAELSQLGAVISRRALNAAAEYMSVMLPFELLPEDKLFDAAIAQRILPALIASAPVKALVRLPELFDGMPRTLEVLRYPIAIQPM